MIWVHSDAEAWEAAKLVSDDGKSMTVRLQSTDKTVTISGGVSSHDSILPGSLAERCDNLVELESFSEGIILHHVRKRFSEDSIYTFVGSILIALNPYKTIGPLYGQPVLDEAFQKVRSGLTPPTHIFSVAALAVHNMMAENKNQSVLISGVSPPAVCVPCIFHLSTTPLLYLHFYLISHLRTFYCFPSTRRVGGGEDGRHQAHPAVHLDYVWEHCQQSRWVGGLDHLLMLLLLLLLE